MNQSSIFSQLSVLISSHLHSLGVRARRQWHIQCTCSRRRGDYTNFYTTELRPHSQCCERFSSMSLMHQLPCLFTAVKKCAVLKTMKILCKSVLQPWSGSWESSSGSDLLTHRLLLRKWVTF